MLFHTVRLYLPRHESAQPPRVRQRLGGDPAAEAGAGGTVLLVEDEAGVRAAAAAYLRELGYTVLEASDGPGALRVLDRESGSGVDALVTDVGLPGGLNGRQVAEMARKRQPGLPVLYITGYAGAILEGQLASDTAVISKPFALDLLTAKLRSALEGNGLTNPVAEE